jgi:hypothetical protein
MMSHHFFDFQNYPGRLLFYFFSCSKIGRKILTVLQFNARNIKGENTGQKTKMNYTPPITALSEMDF